MKTGVGLCLYVYLIRAVSAVIFTVAEEVVVDAPAVGAVVRSGGASRDDAHEGHQGLTGRQLPFLHVRGLVVAVGLEDGSNAVTLRNVGLVHSPVTEVLRNLSKENKIRYDKACK